MEEKIAEIMEKHGVILGYLFGSQARGTAGSLSDIDIAVVFSFGMSDKEQAGEIENIRGEIQHEFKTNYADIINLSQNNNPALRYGIIFGGKAILVNDANLKTTLELKAVRDFEDTKYLRAVQSLIIKNKFNVTA